LAILIKFYSAAFAKRSELSQQMASAVSRLAGSGNERFNAEAANWDKNPLVHEASKEACTALLQRYPDLQIQGPGKGLDVLEIGCGTGILSFNMAPFVRQVVAIDAAEGMIDVLKGKIEQSKEVNNITPIAVLLEDPEDPSLPAGSDGKRMKFDLVLSHLVLHHIPDLKAVLTTMLGCLKSGGSVALTDFEDFGPEARRFHAHAKMAGVERHGINREAMTALMEEVGFTNVKVERAWAMKKQVETYEGEFGDKGRPSEGQGELMNFPFIVAQGFRS
jgi:2-polyprenyl-3-methyl-5-hydroxy-6-metoxy-1,4-benzoquinol methylase